MRSYPDSPVIEIQVNRPTVDKIHVSASAALGGWKLDGFLGEALAPPDQFQDQFDAVVSTLAEYVDDSSVWKNTDNNQDLSPWQALVLLTQIDEQDS